MSEGNQPNVRVAYSGPYAGAHEAKVGDTMTAQGVLLPATATSGAVSFMDDCGGALLSICPTYNGETHPIGTGFMVMPGVAITAFHVFEHALQEVTTGGAIYALGSVGSQLQPWAVAHVTVNGDVALLQLVPKFAIPSHFEIRHFELTARLPESGEAVLALGMISERESYPFPGAEHLVSVGVASSGVAVERLAKAPLSPGPSVHCRFFAPSGMSGGPVFDSAGRVFGLLSNSLEGEEGGAHDAIVPSHWPVLLETIKPPWPPGLYQAASIWPASVHDAWHFGIGQDEGGQQIFIYQA